MDNCFYMEQHVKKKCIEAIYYLRNVSKIHKNISPRTLLKFSFMLLLVLSLRTTVTHFYMVLQNT